MEMKTTSKRMKAAQMAMIPQETMMTTTSRKTKLIPKKTVETAMMTMMAATI